MDHRLTSEPRNWNKPAPFLEYHVPGPKGVFLGFLQALSLASVTITGPEYVSMTAGEVELPRRVMPRAFKTVFWRLGVIFVVSALTVGIVVPPSSEELAAAYTDNDANAAASPYVVSMRSLGIPVLPHIVNALLFTSAFSAGNGYFFCATRTLYGLALAGKVPRVFARTTKKGIPIYPTVAVLAICCISFLQVGSGASVVFSWLISLVSERTLRRVQGLTLTYYPRSRLDSSSTPRPAALSTSGLEKPTRPKACLERAFHIWAICSRMKPPVYGHFRIYANMFQVLCILLHFLDCINGIRIGA